MRSTNDFIGHMAVYLADLSAYLMAIGSQPGARKDTVEAGFMASAMAAKTFRLNEKTKDLIGQ